MTFFRTLFFFLVFWAHQLLILPLLLYFTQISRRQGPAAARTRAIPTGHRWGKMLTWLGGGRLEIIGDDPRPGDETVLVVSNHQGEFDIPILLAYSGCAPGFVAKKELEHIPLVSRWMRLLGCVFLNRDDRREQIIQVREIIELLKSGHSMVIFPEGTRSGSDEILPFAKGSLNIAVKAGVRIMPITLSGSWKLKPKGKFRLPGGKVRLIRHPLLEPAALSPEERGRLHEIVRDQIASAL